jgi:lipopolysaccharide/colanic/teichoic acid biosynthesis glycosyltransferase
MGRFEMKKILITGATGYLGKYLLKYLNDYSYDIILVGRNLQKLKNIFPDQSVHVYDDLENLPHKFDIVIHLAAANNNSNYKSEEFFDANVLLYKNILEYCSKTSVKKVINISTLHVFSNKNNEYIRTKRDALNEENVYPSINIINIFLPKVYGDSFTGKLKNLNILPNILSRPLFIFLSGFKPVVEIKSVLEKINYLMSTSEKVERNIYISDNKDRNIFFNIFKKTVDLSFVIIVAIFFWWLLCIIWLTIKLSSRGPGIFVQKRVGRHEKLFKCYKFRTMGINTENVGTHEIDSKNITKIGKFLRSSKLDELPQIINILRGELSLVGPRPGLPTQKQLKSYRKARQVYSVLPGITGLSQINNIDMSTPQKIAEWDNRYVCMRSIPSELDIILKTLFGRGQGDKVKR